MLCWQAAAAVREAEQLRRSQGRAEGSAEAGIAALQEAKAELAVQRAAVEAAALAAVSGAEGGQGEAGAPFPAAAEALRAALELLQARARFPLGLDFG